MYLFSFWCARVISINIFYLYAAKQTVESCNLIKKRLT